MNFCIEDIGTTVSANQVESDGHEAKKLLNPDPNNSSATGFGIRQRGFMTENFVRPPVTLSLKFPICIEINEIIINPKLGSQTSTAFMIQTETSTLRGLTEKHLVAKEFLNDGNPVPNYIVFKNPRFSPRPPFSLLAKPSYKMNESDEEITFNLKHPKFHALEKVTGLEVTILRIAGSSVPVLGSLQVWGQPCLQCSRVTTNKFLVKWMRRTRNPSKDASLQKTMNDGDEEPQAKRAKISDRDDVPVPEEFLDPITQEIMCQPIRLPCGTAIDSRTLERYYQEESTWGRPPNNPFTGQPFTDSVKPIADAGLKSRIDYFLTQNSNASNLKTVPRALGTTTFVSPRILAMSPARSKESVQRNLPVPAARSNPISSSVVNSKRLNESYYYKQSQPPAVNISNGKNSTVAMATPLSTNSYSMEDRLQEEINKLLGKGSSYMAKDPVAEVKKGNECCQCFKVYCNKDPQGISTIILYRSVTCPHVLVCRPCVLNLDRNFSMKCQHCDVLWNVKDLSRVHQNNS